MSSIRGVADDLVTRALLALSRWFARATALGTVCIILIFFERIGVLP